jgi:FKBP-type peptidyl-prolyl cis-trans isomerase FklB
MYRILLPLAMLAAISLGSCSKQVSRPASANKPGVITDTLSYYLGTLIGQNLRKSGFGEQIRTEEFASAFEAALRSDTPLVAPGVAEAYLMKKGEEKNLRAAEAAKKEGEEFLARNKQRPGVVVTASGLQYEILKAGNGPKPSDTSMVKVHYHGMLIDGTVFDSSVERNEPIDLPVNAVIEGWVEALQLMPLGSKWKLFIPYNLAYGEQGAPPSIPPFATLIFEVELLEIK